MLRLIRIVCAAAVVVVARAIAIDEEQQSWFAGPNVVTEFRVLFGIVQASMADVAGQTVGGWDLRNDVYDLG